ncbi:MAG: ISAs1 family transposase [Kiritimatiellaceae bacterium]|nr:ISAs1 family transposase [Kiritimatiellaceae bacterium]
MKIFPPPYVTREKGHGRIEVRKIQVSTALNDYVTFPYVAQVCRIERITYKLNGERLRQEIAYGITSLPPEKADAKRLLTLNRGHWCIENRLHWVRDVTFDEDRSQIRTGQGPRTMATLRNLAISLFRLQKVNNIAQALRSCSRNPERSLQYIGL